jgi:hypothetical protein
MQDEAGKMPEQYINRPALPFEQLRAYDLKPEHGEGLIGFDDVAVEVNRVCWVRLNAPVFGADFREVAPSPFGGLKTPVTRSKSR